MNQFDHQARLQAFKSDLAQFSPVEIARRHIIFGDCAVISSHTYHELRTVVSEKYNIHPNEVLIVGSAKLGFSIAPNKRYREFCDTSDLDVVIISHQLFTSVWKDVHRYFEQGGYWENKRQFTNYLFRGWIRPDKLPPDQNFPLARAWWSFFNALSASRQFSNIRVTGAIYQSWHFLESYQTIAISQCADELNDEVRISNED